MFKKTPLASAIGSITIASTLAAVGTTLPAYAEETDDQTMEEVVVTGSRIKTGVSDAPRPVTVIDSLDIELAGHESVADVLRTTTYNSLGSFRERSGSSFGQVALVDLRGLGSDRTAVLINGRRVPGNPVTGTSAVDLNSIPLAAVERVEILTDSASAIYGADAIGGVINIIFKEDYDGAEFEIGSDFPDREGADSDHFNITFGSNSDKGHILFSAEWFKRDPIFDADRDYSKVRAVDGPGGGLPRHAIDTTGVSSGGNTGFALDFSSAFQVDPAGCVSPTYIPIADPEGITGSVGCGFGYADLSMQTGGIDRQSTFLQASYEINDDHEVYYENRYSRSKTFGRYAPAVGFFFVEAAAPLNPIGADFFLFHRFVGHGNRNDSTQRIEHDNVLGLKGHFDNLDINYDLYGRYYEYVAQEEGDTYVITSIIEGLVADGSYDFTNPLSQDPNHLAAVAQSSATLFRDISTEYTEFGLTLDGNVGSITGGTIGWAAGVEASTEQYEDQYDSFREAGNTLGSAGNSAGGARSRVSVFGEVQLPILENLDISIQGRYDDYDDFGEEFSPQISVRYQPIDEVIIRASFGEGFKAPNLGQVYQELAQSFETVTDVVRCDAQGIPEASCPASQVEEYTGGNPDLKAETTESFNLGVVVEPIDNLSFSIDWFTVDIEDAVATLDLQNVIEFERNGTLPPGVIVNRGPSVGGVPGVIVNCVGGVQAPACGIINVNANLATLEIEGMDIRARYDWDTDSAGNFRVSWEYSQILTYDFSPSPEIPIVDQVGTEGFPEFRTNVTLRWSMNDFTVNYTYRLIDEHEGVTAGSKYDTWDSHDITGVWHSPWGGDITVGVRNLTDEDPSIDSVSGWDDEVTLPLYDVAGRMYFASYKHTF